MRLRPLIVVAEQINCKVDNTVHKVSGVILTRMKCMFRPARKYPPTLPLFLSDDYKTRQHRIHTAQSQHRLHSTSPSLRRPAAWLLQYQSTRSVLIKRDQSSYTHQRLNCSINERTDMTTTTEIVNWWLWQIREQCDW